LHFEHSVYIQSIKLSINPKKCKTSGNCRSGSVWNSLLKKAKHGQFVMLNPVLNLVQDLVQHLVKSIGYETLNPSSMTAGRQVQGDTNILF